MKIRTVNLVEHFDWDKLVEKTYGRPYSIQQQAGCRAQGTALRLTVPAKDEDEEYMNDVVPEVVNHETMGVKFQAWLERDPKQPIADGGMMFLEMWWHRNFYPSLQAVANDLHAKGLLPAGEYVIEID